MSLISFRNTCLFLAAVILIYMEFAISKGKEKLLLVVEVSRHGIRSSETVLPYTKNHPHDNFEGSRELTALGRQQHYDMGKYLRQKYIIEKKFLSKTYNLNEIYS
jgi:hypothetical protein